LYATNEGAVLLLSSALDLFQIHLGDHLAIEIVPLDQSDLKREFLASSLGNFLFDS
jgi:hypothetical protein